MTSQYMAGSGFDPGLFDCGLRNRDGHLCLSPRGHTDPHRCVECGATFAADPPSGPLAETYEHNDGQSPAFVALLESGIGRAFWQALEDAALAAYVEKEKRFSVRGFLYYYRQRMHVRINNDFTPSFATRLVRDHPELDSIIERRLRTKELS